jgi:hypothetical protein
MCDHEENGDQTQDIFNELLVAEREQEITQATTLQAQIVSLLLLLKEKGLIVKADIDWWENKQEEVQAVLRKTMLGRERAQLADSDYEKLRWTLENLDGTIEFARLLGNTDEDLREVIENRNVVAGAVSEMEEAFDATDSDQGD